MDLTKQLRAILRRPAHLTHATTAAIWEMANLAMPGWTIQQALQRHQAKLQATAATAPDITTTSVATAYVQAMAAALETLLMTVAAEVIESPASDPQVSCPCCQDTFVSENAVCIHSNTPPEPRPLLRPTYTR